MNFVKFLRKPFYRTHLDDCFLCEKSHQVVLPIQTISEAATGGVLEKSCS